MTEKVEKVKLPNHTTRMSDASGAVVEVTAKGTKTGAFIAFAKHVVKNGAGKVDRAASQGRGATSHHATIDEAKSAANALVQAFAKSGWQIKAGGGSQKDRFDLSSLPKAKPAARK